MFVFIIVNTFEVVNNNKKAATILKIKNHKKGFVLQKIFCEKEEQVISGCTGGELAEP